MMNILNQIKLAMPRPIFWKNSHKLTTEYKLEVGLPVSSIVGLGVFISCEINKVFSKRS